VSEPAAPDRGVLLPPDAPSPPEERILQAAMAALAALDPAALTIKQLCGAAQVTPPTLYYHFGNKDGLLAAAVGRLVSEWLEALDSAVDRDAPLDVVAQQAIAAWTGAILSPSRPLAVFSWATLLLAESSELSRRALQDARDRGRSMIAEVLTIHLSWPAVVDAVAGLIVDSVIASAVQFELDRDPEALRLRLESLAATVRLVASAQSTAVGPLP